MIFSGEDFSGDYSEYFGMNTDIESIVYMTLANYMLHKLYPYCITVAEVSPGHPGYSYVWGKMINSSAASRAWDCGNPANLVALAQIRVDRAPDGTRSSRSWRRLRD